MTGLTDKLCCFSMTQLSELLEDDEKLSEIVREMDEMRQVQQSKEVTLASNRSLAEHNLRLQPGLDQQKNQLTKRYRCLQELHESLQMRKCMLDHCSGNSSLDTLLALLQAEGAKIEEATENIADSFLDGDLPLDTFIDNYQSKRKLAHLRRVKIDKLQEIVLKGHQVPPASPTAANGCPVTVSRGPLPATPLPSGPCYAQGALRDIPMANVTRGYVRSYSQQFPPLPQRPTPGMSPRTGYIMQ
ncbi:VPS37B subunit of ESCRT-I b [Denticeps clupeoides]|uniref:VPS37B subunit of ESCRT-I b n=1 Tax=Denticeps clupeoides TaxID=299321 RepID=UPI0010A2BBE1|nr:vacuolar protein sorting-associated protein 37B-like [Denticeps clupeoides]